MSGWGSVTCVAEGTAESSCSCSILGEKSFFKELYLFSRLSPTIFLSKWALGGLHLFSNCWKFVLFLSDLGQMKGYSFKGEPGIRGSLNEEKEMRISLKKISVSSRLNVRLIDLACPSDSRPRAWFSRWGPSTPRSIFPGILGSQKNFRDSPKIICLLFFFYLLC